MPTIKITSFWYAIYKRLWAIGTRSDAPVSTESVSDGNFSIETTSAGNGIFGTTDFGKPLALGDFTAAHKMRAAGHRTGELLEHLDDLRRRHRRSR